MTARDFCYWLQGFFEIQGAANNGMNGLATGQAEMIKRHLALVFIHEIDPANGGDAGKLQEVHDGLAGLPPEPPKEKRPDPFSSGVKYRC